MVKITGEYEGDLHCRATHGPSHRTLETDAPVDNQGRGEEFSPTDLMATALGTCILTTMAIAARRLGLELKGARFEVTKEMSADLPRRITRLATQIWLPVSRGVDPTGALERAAHTCPVHQSLHPSVDQPVVIHWAE
jgi:putative redox protein